MKILIGCEESGIVRRAFRDKGHDAWSCDLIPSRDNSPYHIQDDILNILDDDWDMLIAHPPCTFLTNTANRWKNDYRYPNRKQDELKAIDFVISLWKSKIKRKCIENPIGSLSTKWMKPSQIIHPNMFGEPVKKSTCLWLDNLPLLVPTNIVEVEYETTSTGKRFSKWYWEASKLPKEKRAKVRSQTFQGIANAMAEQWG